MSGARLGRNRCPDGSDQALASQHAGRNCTRGELALLPGIPGSAGRGGSSRVLQFGAVAKPNAVNA
jgi:hypothetical protein